MTNESKESKASSLERDSQDHPLERYADEKHAEDVHVHHAPKTFGDRFAFGFVKFLRVFADAFFANRYGHRAVVLETVAAVPGMVSGAMLHLKCLRRMEDDHGWIRTLLDEAENERMHLMTFIEIAKPSKLERALVIIAQGFFYVWFLILYLISTKSAHRVVGYLEEEAVVSYSEYLKMVEKGEVDNIAAPQLAKEYWNLSEDARLTDVIRVIRADEMMHREVNHLIANKIKKEDADVKIYEDMSEDAIAKLRQYEARQFPD
uniref:alternative oxidase n=1 Tax=Ningiella ruwaisensis TaxID=2364274 RepID=UPI00109F9FBB|nr:alternative oxidase [Ningiella ruwaisensis]